ncbi:sorting nexin-25 [Diorhabda sublineata]|uniref:sorting nexin-25 n=1 Tax=Diorhabda sublineata TaxID=1163346 RepID=UPI0024E0F702|nr:sorting nexin-25 [Diorhabda sublineata]
MNTKFYMALLLSVLLGITLFCPFCYSFVLFGLFLVISILLGILTAFWLNVTLSLPHKTTVGAEHYLKQAEHFRNTILKDYESSIASKSICPQLPQIFGKTVDSLLQQLLDFVLRDYILIYIKDYAYETDALENNIKDDLWGAINNLHEKLVSVDETKLIASDIVMKITVHFEKIREAKALVEDSDHPPVFQLSPHVMSSEKEIEYLRTVSELLIMFLLPRAYSLSPTKYLVREILCCKVFKPLIDTITDPDFFNRNIISYIETTQMQVNLPKKVLENANDFEDLIDKIDDVQVLRSIRYNIVTKLMQATTLQNLNRAKGVDLDNDKNILSSAGIHKSDINAAKKLKKHINQLTSAKKQCEKKLITLGWDSGYQYGEEMKKVLSLQMILDHVLGRKYLSQFLQTAASHDLIRFWSAVEELRSSQKTNWHQIGAEIFYTFIRNPTSEIKVDKNTKKRMEAFLLGDKGPEVFYEVQHQVVQIIEDKYYQPFLISDYYKEMVIAIDNEENISDESGVVEERQTSTDSTDNVENSLNVGDHSNYARRKLDQLEEKLNNKTQALAALRTSMRPESKVLNKLEKEVEWLEGEKRQLEAHITRTEIWADNLGRWRAFVQSAEVSDEKEPPQFVLVVQMSEDESPDGEETICTGWVVCRNLTQFQELHKKLRPLCSDVRNLDLPTNTFKFLFGKSDKLTLEKAKQQIQKYLDFVLKDDRLNQSEAIYAFLSPSSENLKQSTPNRKKSRFSFSTLFKSGSEQSGKESYSVLKESEEDDISQCLDSSIDFVDFTKSNGGALKISDDTIAEPLYALFSEIFDMRGVFKYVRKTLIGFVQVTYGRNINRQIYDTISWWFSEEMLHYYLTVVLKNFWPGGTLAEMAPMRSKEEKLQTALKAQEMFVNNVPELLTTLVGSNAGRLGAKKVFDAFQEKNMNKHLVYEIIEAALDATFPELC